MAVFSPRTSEQILREMLGKLINRTDLSDINVGSSIYTILQSVALELGNLESRLNNIRNGYSLFSATGAELDARCAELPPGTIFRKKESNAGAAVLTISRAATDTANNLIIPAGSQVRSSKNGLIYFTNSLVTIPAGQSSIENVFIICTTPGTAGNADINTIDQIENMPNAVISVNNTGVIDNGIDNESDAFLRARALKYVKSLGKCQKTALEYLAQSYTSGNGQSIKFSLLYEDPITPGYSQLIVDDGAGMVNQSVLGDTTTGTVGRNSQIFFWHQRPATAPITPEQITIRDVSNNIKPITANDYISIPERGLIYFKNPDILEEGDTWTIQGYNVYQGYISDLQAEIEGTNNRSGFALAGYRAAGTRVQVVPPVLDLVNIKLNISVKSGVSVKSAQSTIKNTLFNYINNLNIGQPLIAIRLIQVIQNTGLVVDCNVYNEAQQLFQIINPSTQKSVIRIKLENITYITE